MADGSFFRATAFDYKIKADIRPPRPVSQIITNAPSKTEAVRRTLQNELKRAKDFIPLRDRVKVIRDEVAAIPGPNPEPFDMKKFGDELYEDD